MNLVPLYEERPIRRLQHPIVRMKTDLIMHRATKECELPESADGSLARRAEVVGLGHGSRHVGSRQTLRIGTGRDYSPKIGALCIRVGEVAKA